MEIFAKTVLTCVAVIHLMPAIGVLGGERLLALYGVSPDEPNLQILLRHRAVFFAMLGIAVAASIFVPALRPAAIGAALLSLVTFLLFVALEGGANAELRRAFWIDVVAVLGLLPVAWYTLTTRA